MPWYIMNVTVAEPPATLLSAEMHLISTGPVDLDQLAKWIRSGTKVEIVPAEGKD